MSKSRICRVWLFSSIALFPFSFVGGAAESPSAVETPTGTFQPTVPVENAGASGPAGWPIPPGERLTWREKTEVRAAVQEFEGRLLAWDEHVKEEVRQEEKKTWAAESEKEKREERPPTIPTPFQKGSERSVTSTNARENHDLLSFVRERFSRPRPERERDVREIERIHPAADSLRRTSEEEISLWVPIEEEAPPADTLPKTEEVEETEEERWENLALPQEEVPAVMIGPELAAVHVLLNPPKGLHPYLRLLLYRNRISPEILRWYLAAQEKIRAIYEKAKKGEGKIRYRGKILEAYLPLIYDMGGPYELILQTPPKGNQKVAGPLVPQK